MCFRRRSGRAGPRGPAGSMSCSTAWLGQGVWRVVIGKPGFCCVAEESRVQDGSEQTNCACVGRESGADDAAEGRRKGRCASRLGGKRESWRQPSRMGTELVVERSGRDKETGRRSQGGERRAGKEEQKGTTKNPREKESRRPAFNWHGQTYTHADRRKR